MRLRRPVGATPWAIVIMTTAGAIAAPDGCPELKFDAPTVYAFGDGSTGMDAADVDGDEALDLIVSNRDTSDVTVLMNQGDGTFGKGVSYPAGAEPRYVVSADFNGDEHPDLATVNWPGTVTVLLNDGAGAFVFHADIQLFKPSWLHAADLDGDGDQDILVTKQDSEAADHLSSPAYLTVLENDGRANFLEGTPQYIQLWPRGGAVADFDGDGDLDAVIGNHLSSSLSIAFNDGDGGFSTIITIPTGIRPRYLTATDLDGDDDPDLAVVHKELNELWVFENDGDGVFTPMATTYAVQANPHSIAHGDFDRDGDDDLVVSSVNVSWMDMFINDGEAGFTTELVATPATAAHVVVHDVSGDGRLDLLHTTTRGGAVVRHGLTLTCQGDLDDTASVDFADLLAVLSSWGPCPSGCLADFDCNDDVGLFDLLTVLSYWGSCP